MRWLAIVGVVVLGCGKEPRWHLTDGMLTHPAYRRAVADAGNWRQWAIVVGADRVEVTRIRPRGHPLAHELEDLGATRALRPAEAARLQEILARPRFSPQRLHCYPDPGVRVRFHRGDEAADLLLCYGCGQLVLLPPGASWRVPLWIDFGLERPELVGWARGVFPDEPAFREPIERL